MVTLSLLELLDLMIHTSLFILIWLVQVIIYPSFQYTSQAHFVNWHKRYMQLITYFVLPLMLGQLSISIYQLTIEMTLFNGLVLGMVGLIWLSTFVLSIPLHQGLLNNKNSKKIQQLISTNWYRTVLWTAVLVLEMSK